ncbi:MAG: exopolysaccharide biosynthesis polyprenyl glycosylphosphotransferase [Acidobacteriota bacterium]|nr:exopolysaccharide biosynthesis polyprenyl glycosylphosphotransferase [Acidobacteriota bacterium]
MAKHRSGRQRPGRDPVGPSNGVRRRSDSVVRAAYRTFAVCLDIAAIYASYNLATRFLPGIDASDLTAHASWYWDCVALAVAWLAGLSLLDLYSPRHWRRFAYAWPRAVFATGAATVGGVGLLELVTNLPDHVLYAGLIASQVFAVLASVHRALLYRVVPRRAIERRLLLIGDAPGTMELREALRCPEDPLMRYIGLVALTDAPVDAERLGPVFRPDDLKSIIERYAVTDVVFAHGQAVSERVARALANARRGVRTPRFEDAYGDATGRAAIFCVGRDEWLSNVRWVESNLYATKVKRVLDVLVSLVLLPPAVVLILLCAIATKLDSPGPVFYTQRRVGHGQRLFTLVKLRTMVASQDRARPGAEDDEIEEDAPPLPDDPRITRVGRVLRAISLDELPQLLLVLRGEMSLVGPRPEQPHLVARYESEIPLYSQRHLVRPGLTGWAQVRQSYSESVTDVVSKVQYDLYYISNLSMRLDVLVLMKTIGLVILNPKRRVLKRRRPSGPPDQGAVAP